MITQKIDLNLIHGQVRPRVNVSQYDDGSRTIEASIYNNTARFVLLPSYTATVQGTKPDNYGFQYAATIDTTNNVIVFDVVEQMTAVFGDVDVEIVIIDGDGNRIGTGNFVLSVEPAALAENAIVSESELPLVEEAVNFAGEIPAIMAEFESILENAGGLIPDTMYNSIQTLFNS